MATKNGRCRNYAVTRSYEYDREAAIRAGKTPPAPDEWMGYIRQEWTAEKLKAAYVALIFHDKDEEHDENGFIKIKPLHVHAVIKFKSSITASAVMKNMGLSREQNVKPLTKTKYITESALYLIHVSQKAIREKKHIYDASEVIMSLADDSNVTWESLAHGVMPDDEQECREAKHDAFVMVSGKLAAGDWTLADAEAYIVKDPDELGFDRADWKKMRSGFEKDILDYLNAQTNFYVNEGHQRALVTTFIEGKGGSGKDNISDCLAANYADKHGIHKAAASGLNKTFDFADGYKGQRVSVFSEASGNAFSPDEFNSIFDPKRANVAPSRMTNKPWFAQYCFMTNSTFLEQFIWEMYQPYARERLPKGEKVLHTARDWQNHYEDNKVNDKIRQIRRRFAIWIRLTDGLAHFYYRNNSVNRPHCFIDEPLGSVNQLWKGDTEGTKLILPKNQTCPLGYKDGHVLTERGTDVDGTLKFFEDNKCRQRCSASCKFSFIVRPEWEWIHFGTCDINDNKSVIAMHEEAVRAYFCQDPDYFTVTPWNSPTLSEYRQTMLNIVSVSPDKTDKDKLTFKCKTAKGKSEKRIFSVASSLHDLFDGSAFFDGEVLHYRVDGCVHTYLPKTSEATDLREM